MFPVLAVSIVILSKTSECNCTLCFYQMDFSFGSKAEMIQCRWLSWGADELAGFGFKQNKNRYKFPKGNFFAIGSQSLLYKANWEELRQ